MALLTQVEAAGAHIAGHNSKGSTWNAVRDALSKHPSFEGYNCVVATLKRKFDKIVEEHKNVVDQRAVESRSGTDDEKVDPEVRLLDGIVEKMGCAASQKAEAAVVKTAKSEKQIQQGLLVKEASMSGAPKRKKKKGAPAAADSDTIDVDGDSSEGSTKQDLEGAVQEFLTANTMSAEEKADLMNLRKEEVAIRKAEVEQRKLEADQRHQQMMAMLAMVQARVLQA
ncbi:hypothetical protein JKP88DRAFT_235081 [Tribonema minus]|uniref:Uncharacterized protein n=1 Tax=Tribonema minus TaxID=303371 RepID=A0A835Z7V9_9STRA|nr:hypothetical protein JKP88DRAFT_235081 [Tribonema minus]